MRCDASIHFYFCGQMGMRACITCNPMEGTVVPNHIQHYSFPCFSSSHHITSHHITSHHITSFSFLSLLFLHVHSRQCLIAHALHPILLNVHSSMHPSFCTAHSSIIHSIHSSSRLSLSFFLFFVWNKKKEL